MLNITNTFWAALTVLVASFSPVSARGQNIPNTMWVTVSADASALSECGMSVRSIEGSVQATLRYNRIEITDNMLFPFVEITVNSMKVGDGVCFASIGVAINRADTFPKDDGTYHFGAFQYCNRGSIISGYRRLSGVNDKIRDHINECLASLNSTDQESVTRKFHRERAEQARPAQSQ